MKSYLIFTAFLLVSCSKAQDLKPDSIPDTKSAFCNLIANGGGICTTDWLDPQGCGVGQYWFTYPGTQANIGYDGDWQTNYQRVERSVGQFVLFSPPAPDDGLSYHWVNFKYKSNTRIWCVVQYSPRCTYIYKILEPSSQVTEVNIRIWSPRIYTLKWYNSPKFPGWLEIDQVTVY